MSCGTKPQIFGVLRATADRPTPLILSGPSRPGNWTPFDWFCFRKWWTRILNQWLLLAQVFQARNMRIGIIALHSKHSGNITICMGKKLIVSVTYENERIWIKNTLPYLKCVLRLCVIYGPIYGLSCKSARGPHRRDVTHILSKGNCFIYWNSFIFVGYWNNRLFSHTNSDNISVVFRMLRNNADAHISSLGYLCF